MHRKLWHLLARFQFKDRCTASSLQQQIDEVLRDLVNYVDEIDDKRQQLYGILLELVAKGKAAITPEDLLRKAGLSPLSFRQWSFVKTRLRRYLDRELHRNGYRRAAMSDLHCPGLKAPPCSSLREKAGKGKPGDWLALLLMYPAAKGLSLSSRRAEVQPRINLQWRMFYG